MQGVWCVVCGEGLTLLITRAALLAANWTESTLLTTPFGLLAALGFAAFWLAAASWLAASWLAASTLGTAGIASGVSIAIAIGKAV